MSPEDKAHQVLAMTAARHVESPEKLLEAIQLHIMRDLGSDPYPPRADFYYQGLARALRDVLVDLWLSTQREFWRQPGKQVHYLSMEFLPGPFLESYLVNLGLKECVEQAISGLFTLEELKAVEPDPGLGSGGLGRLASCFLDSMATLGLSGTGYGIRYDYGVFQQSIEQGWQVERCDHWIRDANPWEIMRPQFQYEVSFGGTVKRVRTVDGRWTHIWQPEETVKALPYDTLIPGHERRGIACMRLFAAISSEDFDLLQFNAGDYTGAMDAKVQSESISKVLYPSDEKYEGRILRLKQQYFLVAATLQDVLRRFRRHQDDLSSLPDKVAMQLNDTHPAIAVAELMRILVDLEAYDWDAAWEICQGVFAYTNHTVLPEALETWPVALLDELLPRHLQIIYEINHRFLETLAERFPEQPQLRARLSIIGEEGEKHVRMAHLAIVGSHHVNGVAALHSKILRESMFADFHRTFPNKLTNVTNGVTPRRWLLQINPELSSLISEQIGDGWTCDLAQLEQLRPLADDAHFRARWAAVKRAKKRALLPYLTACTGQSVNPDSLFDVQIKRIHEYKRQLLNLLHVMTLCHRLRQGKQQKSVPRTVILAGKAAPAYHQAKLIIKLATSIAERIEQSPEIRDSLQLLFLPNYCVSQSERVIPATDLSEQISTAGLEASGTGNMKFALNGALTIGTLDGANIEMADAMGHEQMFIFGLTSAEVAARKKGQYDPYAVVRADDELREVLTALDNGTYAPHQPYLFKPLLQSLLEGGDPFMVLADYRAYIEAQEAVTACYLDENEWTRRSILNTAAMGYFSSDRAVTEYARRIWRVMP